MSAATHELVIDWLGRPTTQNAVHRMHWRAVSRDRKLWRQAGAVAVNLTGGKLRGLGAITVEVQGRYPDKRSLPDADALAPAAKGVIDGLVDAAVIPDDTAAHLHGVTYLPPVVVAGEPAALIVRVRSVDAEATP